MAKQTGEKIAAIDAAKVPAVKALVADYHNTRDNFQMIYSHFVKVRAMMNDRQKLPLEALSDLRYCCRLIMEQSDELRKESNVLGELLAKLSCAEWMVANVNNPDKPLIRGEISVGSPDIKMSARVPHPSRDPEDFKQLALHLGFPDDMAVSGLFELRWPQMCDYVDKLQKDGRPLPPGIDPNKTYPNYVLLTRNNAAVDIDLQSWEKRKPQ